MPATNRLSRIFSGPWVLAVAFLVVAVGTAGTNTHFHPPSPVPLAIVLALAALLPAVLRVPAWVALLGSGAVTGVYFVAGFAQGPIFLCLPLVALVVAGRSDEHGWRGPRGWGWPLVAGVVLGVSGLLVRFVLGDASRGPEGWQGVGFAALTAAAVAIAVAVRSRRSASAARARSAASEERLRMAADLHDGVGHGLSVIALQAGAALHVLERDPAAARASLEAIRDTSRESLDLLRRHLARLAEGDSAPRTPEHGLADLEALVARVRAGGLDVGLRVGVGEGRLSPAVAEMAYAVVQEGLTNVLRHAGAARAEVMIGLVGSEELVVTVTDDGPDGRPGGVPHRDGLGLTAMRSRITALGGRLDAGPGEHGFRLCATLPTGPE